MKGEATARLPHKFKISGWKTSYLVHRLVFRERIPPFKRAFHRSFTRWAPDRVVNGVVSPINGLNFTGVISPL